MNNGFHITVIFLSFKQKKKLKLIKTLQINEVNKYIESPIILKTESISADYKSSKAFEISAKQRE